eukprot:CAMPEP_0114442466 /NCGR_PEP_ID=MMETSP0103-20121206/16964_1 /TAXON_ID=37642 ORGANISM="Paraphysomonas imperforata, Strain PA2" /NCGR_SAMPLE_ID=MMETSP0103 /ASSEMBLY_ACC=CAM_ASM_000201 /LENGTH=217 /DNA_ID=CAMNT_0001613731 /DNA_START=15 /DNA_END=666 /DNA_ORIENTATION=+
MVGGEDSLTIVSTGMCISVGFYEMDELSNAVIQPPETITDTQYDRELPTISLPATGMQICSEISGVNVDYIRLYTIEWIDNDGDSSSASVANVTADNWYNLTMYWNEAKNGTTGYVTEIVSFGSDGLRSQSVPCIVAHRDSTSVTYTCNNLHSLCPTVSTERRLSDISFPKRATLPPNHPHFRLSEKEFHRQLDFDYEGEGDDDAANIATFLVPLPW